MKYILSIALFLFPFLHLSSQLDSLKTIKMDIVLSTPDLKKVKTELFKILEAQHVVPEKLEEESDKLTTSFFLAEKAFYEFMPQLDKWGFSVSRKLESTNYTNKLLEIRKEIQEIEEEVRNYEKLVSQLKIKDNLHYRYWEKLDAGRKELRKAKKREEDFLKKNKRFSIKITIHENNFFTHDLDFSFVNMPGIQVSYFLPNGGEESRFPDQMWGYSIKYLLNRRKTYLELGLFRSQLEGADIFNELYKFSLGQDFYSAHLGRGRRRFFNLYSGFKTGLFILSSENQNIRSWFASPSIGLEIFKTKLLLLDTKSSYFLPFKENRNMRGLLFEAAFNVVF